LNTNNNIFKNSELNITNFDNQKNFNLNSTNFHHNKYYILDKNPYYGNTNDTSISYSNPLRRPPPTGIVFADPMGRYGNFDIYEKDQGPYYGNIDNYRRISNINFKNYINVPIEIKDLDYLYNENKIKEKIESDEKKLMKNKNNIYYQKDLKPYYDSSFMEREKNKKLLEEINIERIYDLKFKAKNIFIGEIKEDRRIQNYRNADKEENNNIIRKYYYNDVSNYKHNNNHVLNFNNTLNNSTKPSKYSVFADEIKHNVIETDIK